MSGIKLRDMQTVTHFARQHFQEWLAQAERAAADTDRVARVAAQLCRRCFYARGALAGQAFTERPCGHCGEMQTYSTTRTHRLCKPCGEKLGACVECIADIDLVDRRQLERRR